MISQAQIVIGQSVKLNAESKWLGGGDNPASTSTVGQITGVDGEWINVLWAGSTEPLNYKSFDLDVA